MPNLTCGNVADEVLLALTHGPTPDITDWEVVESTYGGDETFPTASAILRINGHDYEVQITALPDGE